MMDVNEQDINAVCFGILCNFLLFCGEARAKEAAELVRVIYTENKQLRAELEQKSKLIAQQATELERRDKLPKEQEAELMVARDFMGGDSNSNGGRWELTFKNE